MTEASPEEEEDQLQFKMSDKEFYAKYAYGMGQDINSKGNKLIWKAPKDFYSGKSVKK